MILPKLGKCNNCGQEYRVSMFTFREAFLIRSKSLLRCPSCKTGQIEEVKNLGQ